MNVGARSTPNLEMHNWITAPLGHLHSNVRSCVGWAQLNSDVGGRFDGSVRARVLQFVA
jgi:hypothetical protein